MQALHGIIVLLIAMVFSMAASAEVVTGTDEQAGLPYWEWHSQDMSIRLVQRLPDQSRAFFMARGFSSEDAERIAQSCVFQTVYKNTATPPSNTVIEYRLAEWDVQRQGKSSKMKLREHWQQDWDERKLKVPLKLAFEWALLPSEQRYQAGDYNWGMTTYNIPPGSAFDLDIVWYRNGKQHRGVIPGIQCAADIHPTTTGQQ